MSLAVGEGDNEGVVGRYFTWVLRHPSWKTVSPKDEDGKCAIETRHEKTKKLAAEVLGNPLDRRDEIDDLLSSI